jgi:hypothetical protein
LIHPVQIQTKHRTVVPNVSLYYLASFDIPALYLGDYLVSKISSVVKVKDLKRGKKVIKTYFGSVF